jgi:hypothetical protein
MARRPHRFLLALAACLPLLAPQGADAALDVGDAAPEWTVGEMVNGDAVTLKELRGRVVLYEFIGTG